MSADVVDLDARRGLSPAAIAAALGLPAPTAQQAAVIAAPVGPALVVAGAGAGKTETMANRVVWLVANRVVTPDQVLGLTFTRKAAQQLTTRIRTRLRMLAGSRALLEVDPSGELRARVLADEPTVSTYHSYAGRLVAEHGLRLPVEPSARLLGQTGVWQLAHRVVSTWDTPLDLDVVPETVTERLLGLAGQLAEHLVDPDALTALAAELERLVATLPAGERQRGGPTKALRDVLAAQQQRLALLPLLEQLRATMRQEGVLDHGTQMSYAARVAAEHPEVGEVERSRFRAVLLDEYQDTGHAQRVLLRALFGAGPGGRVDRGLALTAVGDPIQSIYGWRGASAANLPRFATDFPRDDRGTPAPRLELLTSWRNPARALVVANGVSADLRAAGVPVAELGPRPGAPTGDVRTSLHTDVEGELGWLAGHVAARWSAAADLGQPPPTSAVLVRRRADTRGVAEALRARGLPVEVVGLGGLLDTPEVRDVVSMLALVADPLAGSAAVRLLTGARAQLGAADLVALWRRARELAGHTGTDATPGDLQAAVDSALPGEHAELAGLADALADPGRPERYSARGHRALVRLGRDVAELRERSAQPLPDLVADVERTLGVDVEVMVRAAERGLPPRAGRAQLDAFADHVSGYVAATPAATLTGLLDHLRAAEAAEDGLSPAEVEVSPDRVQVLTVHAAKGLEWQLVAVPHLVTGVFPPTKRSSSWLRNPVELPSDLRGDAARPVPGGPAADGSDVGVPVLDVSGCTDRKQLEAAFVDHEAAVEERRLQEERRLLYVAVTRTEHTLLLSGHHWGATGSTPKGPSVFLDELRDLVEGAGGDVEEWAAAPADGEANPVLTREHTAAWPAEPLGARRDPVTADLVAVAAALAAAPTGADGDDAEGWAAEVDALLAERAERRARRGVVTLPGQLSVSTLVALAEDPDALAARVRRPLPFAPNPLARRGTAFHAWVERRSGSTRLLDFEDLPGAADTGAAPDSELADLQAAFLASSWADRTPTEVEVPFEMVVSGVLLRGRMDAVFTDPDGGYTVVDWKTGPVPPRARQASAAVQLAAYRLAWAELAGVGLDRVRAAFHHVRAGVTLAPADLLDLDGLREVLRRGTSTTG
ncbi:ATP-dependent DNA helicase [Rhodococcus aerolatus]